MIFPKGVKGLHVVGKTNLFASHTSPVWFTPNQNPRNEVLPIKM